MIEFWRAFDGEAFPPEAAVDFIGPFANRASRIDSETLDV